MEVVAEMIRASAGLAVVKELAAALIISIRNDARNWLLALFGLVWLGFPDFLLLVGIVLLFM